MTATAEKTSYLPDGLPKPAPAGDGLGKEYWEGTRRHELWVQRCNGCKGWQWGPEWICNQCHSFDLTYEQVEPTGVVYSWERAWYPVHPALKDATPYITVLVELPQAGNIRMVGNLVGDPMQTVNIGGKVEAVFEDHDSESTPYTLVQWRAVE